MPTLKQIIDTVWSQERWHRMCPPGFIKRFTRGSSAEIEFANGSSIIGWGFNNAEGKRGGTLHGIVNDEWQLCNPALWKTVDPMLNEFNAWRIVIGTPLGDNHFKRKYEQITDWSKQSPADYYATLVDCVATGLVPLWRLKQLFEEDKLELGLTAAKLGMLQEYLCSWKGGSAYAVFLDEMMEIIEPGNNRIQNIGMDPSYPVHIAFDLANRTDPGSDFIVAIAFQVLPSDSHTPRVHILNYMFDSTTTLQPFFLWADLHGYMLHEDSSIIMPHDWNIAQMTDYADPNQWAAEHNVGHVFHLETRPYTVNAEEQRLRYLLQQPTTIFSTECTQPCPWNSEQLPYTLVDSLRRHERKYNPNKGMTEKKPSHHSHFADAARYMATALPDIYENIGIPRLALPESFRSMDENLMPQAFIDEEGIPRVLQPNWRENEEYVRQIAEWERTDKQQLGDMEYWTDDQFVTGHFRSNAMSAPAYRRNSTSI